MTQRRVMIRGEIFNWEDKAPFVVSGVSIYGALEYDFQSDRIKCHECGEWFHSLCSHIGAAHDLNHREYKGIHGLCVSTGIVTPLLREQSSHRAKVNSISIKGSEGLRIRNEKRKTLPNNVNLTPKKKRATFSNRSMPRKEEMRNKTNRCLAQLIFRISVLVKELGRTPTRREMAKAGIPESALKSAARMRHNAALEMAGFEVYGNRFEGGNVNGRRISKPQLVGGTQ